MKNTIAWIKTVDYADASAALKAIYDGVRSPGGALENLYRGFSLRPHIIGPADDLYRAVLHHDANTLPKWFSELLGAYVAQLAGCEYAFAHHSHNFKHLYESREKAEAVLQALRQDCYRDCGTEQEINALRYAKKLALRPEAIEMQDIDELRRTGWSDGEILEIAQVVAMFSYFTRIINGVGISLKGDKIGLY